MLHHLQHDGLLPVVTLILGAIIGGWIMYPARKRKTVSAPEYTGEVYDWEARGVLWDQCTPDCNDAHTLAYGCVLHRSVLWDQDMMA